jgi:hypothetical protein
LRQWNNDMLANSQLMVFANDPNCQKAGQSSGAGWLWGELDPINPINGQGIEFLRKGLISKGGTARATLYSTASGASVAIADDITKHELQEFKLELAQDQEEFERRWRMVCAMDEVMGRFEGSALARRQLEVLDAFVWMVTHSPAIDDAA